YYVIQKKARGLGDAVLHAEKFAGNDSFAVFLPDDIIFSKKPAMKQMIEVFEKYKKHVVSVETVEKEMISSYGIIKPGKIADRIFEILDMAEKPKPDKAYSNLGIVGRYILPPTIFGYIRKTQAGAKGEIQLTDALKMAMGKEGLVAHMFEGDRCDAGDKYGYIMAFLKSAIMKKEYSEKLKKDIKKVIAKRGGKK
ncbi:MAG TPA: UTP--glucose-1-phosphate uridylyltransferase, partial [Firmicutes bacterium]|nr:UTP--glucose-1-phosphate uridylyltransferase [Bacillota bacterium]